MKIYTKAGDDGWTALFGGGRVPKAALRVEAYGTVDELNSVLGMAVTQIQDETIRTRVEGLQHDLFTIGADLATPPAQEGRTRPQTPPLPVGSVARMEAWIDEATEELPELRAFILPGGTSGAAALHVARTVSRRAERVVVALAEADTVDEMVIRYLNRLSDFLFTMARLENHRAGAPDVEWTQPQSPE